MSNTERQRRFRAAHPGYYGRLHAKRRAGSKAAIRQMQLAHQAALVAAKQAAKGLTGVSSFAA